MHGAKSTLSLRKMALRRLTRTQQNLLILFLICMLSYRYGFQLFVLLLTRYTEWKVDPPLNIVPSYWNYEGEKEGSFTHRFVHIDRTLNDQITNVTFHYVTAGNNKNPAVVFFHGATDTWYEHVIMIFNTRYEWHNQMEDLKDEFYVVSFDMKSYGQSSKQKSIKMWPELHDIGGNFSAHMLVDEVVAAIDKIGIEQFHLVTIDMSSYCLYRIPVQYPEKVLSYTKMQSTIGVLETKHQPQYKFFKNAPKQTSKFMERFRDTLVRSLFQRHEKSLTNPRAYQTISNEELDRILHEFSYPDGNPSAWVQYVNFLDAPFRDSLRCYPQYKCPVYIMQGANDPGQPPYYFDGTVETIAEDDFFWPWSDFFPYGPVQKTRAVQNGKKAEDFFPNAPVALYESVAEAGHFLPLEKPKYTSDSLRLFFKGKYDEIRKRAAAQPKVAYQECDNAFGGTGVCKPVESTKSEL